MVNLRPLIIYNTVYQVSANEIHKDFKDTYGLNAFINTYWVIFFQRICSMGLLTDT